MDTTVTIKCPYCRTVRSGKTLRNTQFRCAGCGAQISVDNNGNIRSTRPPKK